jgi:16S rRNA (uracil1498-N3)-methyltransferase
VGGGGPPRVISLVEPGDLAAGQIIELDAEEAHHLRVRRAAPGDHIGLRDGAGLVANAVLLEAGSKKALVRVVDVVRAGRPPGLELLVGAGDKDRFGWLVEKAAELAVTDVTPVETEYSMRVATALRPGQLAKLQRRALDAVKQSGAAWAPAVGAMVPFADALTRAADAERLIADAAGEWPALMPARTPVSVLVGPEGGFTGGERSAAIRAGWRAVRLAGAVLRFETAAISAAAYVGIVRGGSGD